MAEGLVSSGCLPCERNCGDVNGDGDVNVLDVNLAGNNIASPPEDGLEACAFWAQDVNGDGTMNVLDLTMIVNMSLEGSEGCAPVADPNNGGPGEATGPK